MSYTRVNFIPKSVKTTTETKHISFKFQCLTKDLSSNQVNQVKQKLRSVRVLGQPINSIYLWVVIYDTTPLRSD